MPFAQVKVLAGQSSEPEDGKEVIHVAVDKGSKD